MAKKPKPPPPAPERSRVTTLPATWQAGLAVLGKYGVSTVIALGLVYLIAMSIPTRLDSHIEDTTKHETSTQKLISLQEQQISVLWQLVATSQKTCFAIAKTDQAKIDCAVIEVKR